MGFTGRIIEALLSNDNGLDMTIKDIQIATIQEILLFYTYTTIVGKVWEPDFYHIETLVIQKRIIFRGNHDVLAITYLLTNEDSIKSEISQESKDDIIKYIKLYDIVVDENVCRIRRLLSVDKNIVENRKEKIFKAHSNSTKSARSDITLHDLE